MHPFVAVCPTIGDTSFPDLVLDHGVFPGPGSSEQFPDPGTLPARIHGGRAVVAGARLGQVRPREVVHGRARAGDVDIILNADAAERR